MSLDSCQAGLHIQKTCSPPALSPPKALQRLDSDASRYAARRHVEITREKKTGTDVEETKEGHLSLSARGSWCYKNVALYIDFHHFASSWEGLAVENAAETLQHADSCVVRSARV